MTTELSVINPSDKAGIIYRTGALNYAFGCDHCPSELFTNISDVLDHIEAHFFDISKSNNDSRVPQSHPVNESTGGDHHQCVELCDDFGERSALESEHSQLQCKFCEVISGTTAEFLDHLIERHLSGSQWVCSICSVKFIGKTEYHQHLQDHNAYPLIVSDVLVQCERDEDGGGGGTNVKQQVESLQCDICGAECDRKSKMALHMKKNHIKVKRGTYKCDHCDRTIRGKLLFYAHQYEHLMSDGGDSKNRFVDGADEVSLIEKLKTFLNDNILYDESVPENAFGCKICCHLSVKRRKNIETHILQEHVHRLKRTKRLEKRFSCEYCGQKFTLSHNLIVHKRIHTQERPYQCRICNKSFSHSSYMKYHEKVHSGQSVFQCATCGVSFKSKTKLNQHNKIHSTETKKCPICAKEFKLHRLNVHIKHVHENEHRPYKCADCPQAFKTAKTLKTHMYRHGEKKFECRFHCNERFTSTAGRRSHERSKHESDIR